MVDKTEDQTQLDWKTPKIQGNYLFPYPPDICCNDNDDDGDDDDKDCDGGDKSDIKARTHFVKVLWTDAFKGAECIVFMTGNCMAPFNQCICRSPNQERVEQLTLGSLRIDDFPENDDVSTLEVVYAHALPDVALFRASS